MVTIVPVRVSHASIIGVVFDDLLLCQTESVCISVLALSQVDQLVHVLSTKGCFAEVRCNRRSHLIEDHDVVFGHLRSNLKFIN